MSLGVGIIGLGVMGAEHLRILREETSGAHVAAICDADAARLQTLSKGDRICNAPEEVILSDAVEAVVIASPDETHGRPSGVRS